MDYDDNEFQGQNLQLGGEGCSKVSPFLHSYALPKFDFDDSLQGHLRFDSLGENEVFQQDNHWIEEYSPRPNNVWSEATSSESVEMLLKSVGQEEKAGEEPIIKQLDTCNQPSSDTKIMDPNLNENDGKELDSVVLSEGQVDSKSDDIVQKEAKNLVENPESSENAGNLELLTVNNENQKSNADSLTKISPIKNSSIEENENDVEKNASQQITSDAPAVSADNLPETASERSIDVSFSEKKNVEPSLSEGGSKENIAITSNIESDVAVEAEQVTAMESDKGMAETDEQPKSPIFGVSLVHHDNKEKIEVDKSENNIPHIENVDVSDSNINPSSLTEKDASSDLAEKVEQEPESAIDVARPSESDANHLLEKSPFVSPKGVSSNELSQSVKDNEETTKDVTSDSSLPSKATDSLGKDKQEEKNFTFEVGKSSGVEQASKGLPSYPPFQVSMLPKNTEGPSTDSSSRQLDAKKLPEVSVSPQNSSPIAGKPKAERKPRRKSVAKKETTSPARGSVRADKSSVSLTPPATGKALHVQEAKVAPAAGGVLSLPKLPDLNNSTPTFQQPFTDNQQVQLRAQILVYGSLISGSPPEEPHMIAAFGQPDGGRIWEGVWRACLERLHAQKAQPNPNTPVQSRPDSRDAGTRVDQGTKHNTPIQNKITSLPSAGTSNKGTPPPNINPLIPLSSPLWNVPTPSSSNNLQPSGIIPRPRIDFHQPLSPLHPYQTPPLHNFTNNPSWLSQGPFPGQWVTAFNTGPPRFPTLPVTDPLKQSTPPPLKHTSTPMVLNSTPVVFPDTSTDTKTRKRKKAPASAPQVALVSAPVIYHVPQVPLIQTDSVTAPVTTPFSASKGGGDRNKEKVVVISEETLTKVNESRLQAEEAAKLSAAAATHCNGVWSQLATRNSSGLSSDDEAKLVSSAVSIAAAASVAKVAAAAAKIASDVAEQAKLMVNVVPNSVNYDLASSKHAENLDAIMKAAELAAEAVSQAGKIVAMSEPFSLRHLIEAGPDGYWKTPALTAGNMNVFDKKNDKNAPQVSDKGITTTKSAELTDNQTMEVDGIMVPSTIPEKNKRKVRVRKGPDVSKTIGVASESDHGSIDTAVVSQIEPKVTTDALKENDITEGCLVEVYKDDDKYKGSWFSANVLSLKDGKALVSYTEIQSDDGSGKLQEWVGLEVEGSEVPKIRVAHPVTRMSGVEGTRKRRRTAVTDIMWSSGDRVDVWVQDRWREGVVTETNKIDLTSLTVQFPGQGETSVVRSWFVRPTFIWKDGKWIDSHTSEGRRSSQGDAPQEKRMKLGSPIVEGKRNEGPSEAVDNVDSKKQEEPEKLAISAHESVFNIGSTKDKKKITAHRTVRSGLQKEGQRVVFGVPKPGKKQKFMEVSKRYVADADADVSNNKVVNKTTPHDSVKFTRYLIPQAPGSRGWKTGARNDTKDKQTVETKPRTLHKPRKPPIPFGRTSKSDDNQVNEVGFGSSSNVEDADVASSLEVPVEASKTKPERLNKRKFVPTAGKAPVVEKTLPEAAEPRRSNRRIQPTSRLLEGLQSSMTISKIPSASHSTPRSHTKVTPKGNTNNG